MKLSIFVYLVKLQALVYYMLPPTTTITDCATICRYTKLPPKGQFLLVLKWQ